MFNCTHGRAGSVFLTAMLEDLKAQLKVHGVSDDPYKFFDHVIFCTNVTYSSGGWKSGMLVIPYDHSNANKFSDLTAVSTPDEEILNLKTQHDLAAVWSSLIPSFPKDNIRVLPSIEHAVNVIKDAQSKSGRSTSVLVTGSLHLVGGLIEAAGLSSVAL